MSMTTDHGEDAAAVLVSDLASAIRAEHRANARRFERILVCESADERAALWTDLLDELLAHCDAEQELVYRPLMEEPDLFDRISDRIDQHDQIREELERLEGLGARDPRFIAIFGRLRRLVAAHDLDEERHLLPLAEATLELPTLDDLAVAYSRRKQMLVLMHRKQREIQ